ncbi:MAG: glutamine--fructose-6-phosphate transaminase (isomerizing) [Planctomycetota bacterium]|nr:MAG: glutamine--fructose-6-phosphate transaminase (isomerizing) [Planctomycetota bacterium]
MCGIVAAVSAGGDVAGDVLAGLRTLEYRGYDSAGIAVLADGGIEVRRKMGKIAVLERELAARALPPSPLALAHTRWATHGAPADRNAHPHTDDAGAVVVVHNGIIENYRELRGLLQAQGHAFRSETDTEVLAHLIGHLLREDGDLHRAVRRALDRVHGAYALVAAAAGRPDLLVAARRDSPLVIGLAEGACYAASDMPALLHRTRDFLVLENGETAVLTPNGAVLYDGAGRPVERPPVRCDWTPEQAEKGGYPHFMLKEIEEQPDVLARTAFDRLRDDEGDVEFEPGFDLDDQALAGFRRLRFMAMGTSFHAALLGKLMLEELAALPGDTLNASEFLYSPRLPEEDALTVVISQSGETADSLRAMREVQARGGRVLGVCNVRGATLEREADHVILTHCGPEVGVASTKAFFGQVTALYLLALRVGRARGVIDRDRGRELLADLRRLRPRLDALFGPATAAPLAAAAELLAPAAGCLFLGRCLNHPIALEGALKLKEISYIHAEGYPAGEMKHGPIALISPEFPVVAIATPGRTHDKMLSNIEEVKARAGRVIAVGLADDRRLAELADVVLPVPEVPELLSPLVNVIPLQRLAYETARRLGREIDQPRNLAKSVTVE